MKYIASTKSRNQSANLFHIRLEAYKEEILFDDELIHMKASQAAYFTFCSVMENSLKLPIRECVLQCCNQCPTLIFPYEEKLSDSTVPLIKFHIYKIVSRCNIHDGIQFIDRETCKSCQLLSNKSQKGKVYTKKKLVLFEDNIVVFHEKYYLPSITKLAILGTNYVGATRRDALKHCMAFKDIKCRRYYAERLSAIFGTQIQSEYYGT
jgi:hypothetical protein